MTRKARRMSIATAKPRIETENAFAARHGDYAPAFVLHAETGTKTRAHINRESTILEKWMREGPPFFPPGACLVIRDCQYLWHRMGSPRLAALYGEWLPRSTGDGLTQHEASSEIEHLLAGIPRVHRDVFENVVRHLEPAGVAGSRLATNAPGQIAAAKHIVGLVACIVAARKGY